MVVGMGEVQWMWLVPARTPCSAASHLLRAFFPLLPLPLQDAGQGRSQGKGRGPDENEKETRLEMATNHQAGPGTNEYHLSPCDCIRTFVCITCILQHGMGC